MRNIAIAILLLFQYAALQAQTSELPAQFGIRFGYGLEFPSKNTIQGQDFSLFEAGHRLSYGAYVNLHAEPFVQFSPYIGFEHIFWPKSESYSGGCEADSFPTFHGVDDSLPGRDFRFYNIAFEPAFKFFIPRLTIFLKVQGILSLNIRTRVENYTHTCGAPIAKQWLEYVPTTYRKMSNLNFGLGFGIVKEVRLNSRSGFSLEPGFRAILSPLLRIRDPEPEGASFSLYPWGFYVNVGFFR